MCDFEEVSLNTNYRRFASASTSTLTSYSTVSLAGDNKKDRTLSGRLSRVSSTTSLSTTPEPPSSSSKHKKPSNKYRNSSLSNLSKLDAIDDVPAPHQVVQPRPQSRQNSVCSTQHSISPTTSPRHSRTSVYSFQSRSSVALSEPGSIVLPKRQPSQKEKKAANRKKILQNQQSFVDDDDEDAIDIDDLSAWNIPLAPSLYQKTRESSSKLALETLGAASHANLPNQTQQQQQHPSINHNNTNNNNNNNVNAPSPAMDSSANSTTSTMLSSDDPNTPDGSFSVPRIMDMSSLFDSLSPIAQELSVAFTESPKALQHEQKIELAQNRHSSGSTNSAGSSLSSPASCTRPAFLPPKDRKEEKKHLREYQRMVEERAAVEKALAAKEAKRQSDRASRQRENAFRWKSEIIPNFQQAIQNPATRELWWAGVPSASRGFVWTERIGNALELSQPQFDKLSKKSNSKAVEFADVDLDTVYPELKMFGAGCPYHDDLEAVLRAHTAYWASRDANANPHTAKVANAAASLILALGSPFQSWVALENLLTRGHLIKPMFARDEQALIACYTSFLKVFSTRLPSLYRHFQSQNVSPSAYLTPLVMSLFTEPFSLDVTFRIWDVMLFEGDSFMFRVALATLAKLEPYLYGSKDEIMAQLQSDKLQRETEDEFMDAVRQVLRVSQ